MTKNPPSAFNKDNPRPRPHGLPSFGGHPSQFQPGGVSHPKNRSSRPEVCYSCGNSSLSQPQPSLLPPRRCTGLRRSSNVVTAATRGRDGPSPLPTRWRSISAEDGGGEGSWPSRRPGRGILSFLAGQRWRVMRVVSQTHWESRPKLDIDLKLEPPESRNSDPRGKPVG